MADRQLLHCRASLESARLPAVLRRMQRLFARNRPTLTRAAIVFDWPAIEHELDLTWAIEGLGEPARSVAMLRTMGASVKEIAERMHMSQRTTYRTLACGAASDCADGWERALPLRSHCLERIFE